MTAQITSEHDNVRQALIRVAAALDELGARIHRDLHVESSYIDLDAAGPDLQRILESFSEFADERLAIFSDPVVKKAMGWGSNDV